MANDTENYFLSKQLKENIKDKPKGDKKGILQNSYKKYEYELNFDFNPNGNSLLLNQSEMIVKKEDILNYYLNFCCKSIGKLDLNLQDNTTKMFGRSFVTPSYMSFQSPLTIEFYDVNINPNDKKPYMLSEFFKDWIEFAHGSTNYINSGNYTRLAYLDAYAANIKVKATNVNYGDIKDLKDYGSSDSAKNELAAAISNAGATGISAISELYNTSDKNLFENTYASPYSAISSGTKTIHGATNVFLYCVLLASSIIDLASIAADKIGSMTPQKVRDMSNAQEAYGASRLPLVGGAGTIVAKAVQTHVSKDTNNDYSSLKKSVEDTYIISQKDNFTDEFHGKNLEDIDTYVKTEGILEKLSSKQTYSVELLHYLEKANNLPKHQKIALIFKKMLSDIEFESLSGGKIGYKIPQPYSNEGTPYSEPKINGNISIADLWNNYVINRFMFDNEEEAKKTKQRLLDIADMIMLGTKPMDIKRIEENLIEAGNYLTGDVSENFVKKVADKCREALQKSDYYDLNKNIDKAENNDDEYVNSANAEEIKSTLVKIDSFNFNKAKYYLNYSELSKGIEELKQKNKLVSGEPINGDYYEMLIERVVKDLGYDDGEIKDYIPEIRTALNKIFEEEKGSYKFDFSNYTNKNSDELNKSLKQSNTGPFSGYSSSEEKIFITSRNAMIDVMAAFNIGIGIAIVATAGKSTSAYFQMTKNPHFNGWIAAINKIANAMFINGGMENYVNDDGKDILSATWSGENTNIIDEKTSSKLIDKFIKDNHTKPILKSNPGVMGKDEKGQRTKGQNSWKPIDKNQLLNSVDPNTAITQTDDYISNKPKNSVDYTLTYAYPSKINITDTFSNDAVGQQSMPIIQVQFQFLDVKKTKS